MPRAPSVHMLVCGPSGVDSGMPNAYNFGDHYGVIYGVDPLPCAGAMGGLELHKSLSQLGTIPSETTVGNDSPLPSPTLVRRDTHDLDYLVREKARTLPHARYFSAPSFSLFFLKSMHALY